MKNVFCIIKSYQKGFHPTSICKLHTKGKNRMHLIDHIFQGLFLITYPELKWNFKSKLLLFFFCILYACFEN